MSYLRRYPPQGGRKGHLHSISATHMPSGGPELAAMLWSNGITAVADLREEPDPALKDNIEQYGVAYGHVPAEESNIRLRRAEQLYHTLVITGRNSVAEAGIPLHPLPCEPPPDTAA